jgi:hypothetical protein
MTELEIVGNVESSLQDVLDTAVGGAAYATDPVRRPRTTARRARKRGAEVTEEVASEVREAVDTAVGLPERVLHIGLRRVRHEAARRDAVGAAARAILQAVNTPASTAAGFFVRLEKETAVPRPRRGRGRASATTATRRTTRKAAGTVRKAAGTARKATGRTRGRATQSRGARRSA